MTQPTVLCITKDRDFATALRSLAEERSLSFSFRFHDPEDPPHLSAVDAASSIVLIDADDLRDRALELLPSYEGASTIVVGGIAAEAILGQASSMFGSEFILKDGEYHFVAMIPLMVRKIIRTRDRDMTNRDIIRSSERRYENLVQALPDVVYKIDPNGYFTFVNESVRNFGYAPEELLGQHFSTIVAREDLPKVSRRRILSEFRGKSTGADGAPGLFDERRTGERRTRGLEIRLKKGVGGGAGDRGGDRGARQSASPGESEGIIASLTSYGEITATGHYLGDTQERYFTGTVGIIRDITQRRKSEQRLTQLSLAIEQIAVGICITDPVGTVIYANPFFFRLNVLTPDEILGRNVRRLARRYLQEETLREIRDAMEAEEPWEDDRIIWKRSGESYWSWLKIYPVRDMSASVAQYIIFQQDISDRKQSEMDLRSALEVQRRTVRSVHNRVRSSLETLGTLAVSLSDAVGENPVTAAGMIRYYARFHEFVYEGNDYDTCDVSAFLKEALPELVAPATRRSRKVGITTSAEAGRISVLQALPVIVIVGTVVAAATNRNFPRGRRGNIRVSAALDDELLTLEVAHPGTDPLRDGKGDRNNESDLVAALVSQVDGTFETIPGDDETRHLVSVPAAGR
ncbi:MAG: PAS domain S-box protein [Spirochaetota bacterium]